MDRIKRYWNTPKDFSASHYCHLVIGVDVTVGMSQLWAYLLLQQSVRAGHVPAWTTDAIIMSVSALTALSAPYISWLGAHRRRRTMIGWCLVIFITILLFFLVPSIEDTEAEACQQRSAAILPNKDSSTTVRILVLVIIAAASTIAGVAFWSHGVAYIDENDANAVKQHGLLVFAKVINYFAMYKMTKDLLTEKLWLNVILTNSEIVCNVPTLIKTPKEVNRNHYDQQGFLTSLGRVASNKLALSQIISMSFLVAGFWGSAYYHNDIIKASFLFIEPKGIMSTYTDLVYYLFVILAVCFIGLRYSEPVMASFNKHSALKMSSFLATALFGMYIAISFILCEKGPVAGLVQQKFVQPMCSRDCSCSPQLELNPVCDYNEMVTYLSPCHAGCTNMTDLHGISVWSNCSCSVSGRTGAGVCAGDAGGCLEARELYRAVWLMLIVFFSLTLMLQMITILRSVDVRDKGVAVGVMGTVVYTITFVASHVVFASMAYLTCSWLDAGVCKLHNSKFPYMTHVVSASFSLFSALLSYTSFLLLRKSVGGNEQADEVST